MDFNPEPFIASPAFKEWLKIVGTLIAVGAVVAFIITFVHYGAKGPKRFITGLGRSLLEFFTPVPRRVYSLATLTFKESVRSKVLLVFVLFAVLFMFASWFMTGSVERADLEVRNHISFALKVISTLVLMVLILLSCWGIPIDIKARSLHTVVTKPVTCMEVVLGRFLGYLSLGSIVLLVMGSIGYIWIVRQTPPEDRAEHLICRVPHFGELSFVNKKGKRTERGINTGDIWNHRSFIHGGSPARAIWVFHNVTKEDLKNGNLHLESHFEAYRTNKGDISKGVSFQFTLINDRGTPNPKDDLAVPLGVLNSQEFKTRVTEIPQEITYYDINTKSHKKTNLFENVVHDKQLIVKVACLDRGQNIGMAQPDLFIRKPDKQFFIGYSKAMLGIWLMMAVVVAMGVSASTFVKGPIATGTVFSFIIMGSFGYRFLTEIVTKWGNGVLHGGGLTESVYRMITHTHPRVRLGDGLLFRSMKYIDSVTFYLLKVMSKIIPDLTQFDNIRWVANGFDVPWRTSLFHAIAVAVGFIIPAILLGFFSLKYRELESK